MSFTTDLKQALLVSLYDPFPWILAILWGMFNYGVKGDPVIWSVVYGFVALVSYFIGNRVIGKWRTGSWVKSEYENFAGFGGVEEDNE